MNKNNLMSKTFLIIYLFTENDAKLYYEKKNKI